MWTEQTAHVDLPAATFVTPHLTTDSLSIMVQNQAWDIRLFTVTFTEILSF